MKGEEEKNVLFNKRKHFVIDNNALSSPEWQEHVHLFLNRLFGNRIEKCQANLKW